MWTIGRSQRVEGKNIDLSSVKYGIWYLLASLKKCHSPDMASSISFWRVFVSVHSPFWRVFETRGSGEPVSLTWHKKVLLRISACRIQLSYYSNPVGFYAKTMSAHGSHLVWRSWSPYTILKVYYPKTIHAMFALNWLTGFREDF
jgi:hypothetical protein